MSRQCPICNRQLEEDVSALNGVQYICGPSLRDHHYSELIKDNEVVRIKIRLTSIDSQLYLHVHLKENYSEVWTQPNDVSGRVKINKAVVLDFSNLEALKNKLQTYLLLS